MHQHNESLLGSVYSARSINDHGSIEALN